MDRETRSLWDHITGTAIDGPLRGHQLDAWPIQITTVQAACTDYSNVELSTSSYRSVPKWVAGWLYPKFIHARVLLPFFFRWSMQTEPDRRLPQLTQGLGVIVNGRAKYYPIESIPMDGLEERWWNRTLRVEFGKIDRAPRAFWCDTNERPMQLLSRWYGFSFTYPDCDIYQR